MLLVDGEDEWALHQKLLTAGGHLWKSSGSFLGAISQPGVKHGNFLACCQIPNRQQAHGLECEEPSTLCSWQESMLSRTSPAGAGAG